MRISKKEIKKTLERDLINEGEMAYNLYLYELKKGLPEFKTSMTQENDDFFFAVTVRENEITENYDTAMVLIEKSGKVHINEAARNKLQEIWVNTYTMNMKKLIPEFARQLNKNEIPLYGGKTAFQA